MSLRAVLFAPLILGLVHCAGPPGAEADLRERLVGRWQAQTQHSVETDSLGRVVGERTDSAGYGLDVTLTHLRYCYTRDFANAAKIDSYTLRGMTLVVSEDAGLGLEVAVLEVTPTRLVLRQVVPGYAKTQLSSTTTYSRSH